MKIKNALYSVVLLQPENLKYIHLWIWLAQLYIWSFPESNQLLYKFEFRSVESTFFCPCQNFSVKLYENWNCLQDVDSTCLADYCDITRCDIISGKKTADFWDVSLCLEQDMLDLRQECLVSNSKCICYSKIFQHFILLQCNPKTRMMSFKLKGPFNFRRAILLLNEKNMRFFVFF